MKKREFGSGGQSSSGRGGRGGRFTLSSNSRSSNNPRANQQGGSNKNNYKDDAKFDPSRAPTDDAMSQEQIIEWDNLDSVFGFERFVSGTSRTGWLLNMVATSVYLEDKSDLAAVELYFLQQDGSTFKGTFVYRPYFYLKADPHSMKEVLALLEKKYFDYLAEATVQNKVDLEAPNHLGSSDITPYIKLSFRNLRDLSFVKRDLQPIIAQNKKRASANAAYVDDIRRGPEDFMESLMDMREHDVPYVVQVAIDNDIRVGAWYEVTPDGGYIEVSWLKDMIVKAEPRVIAFDIECTKAPLKFPDAETDQIFMISYMLDGQGYLIINREIVSEDVDSFEYTPKPQYQGPFEVFNEADEVTLLKRFFTHVRESKPHIFVTFNGDFFDWPFVAKRASVYGIDLAKEIGVREVGGEYVGRCSVHLDSFCWVKRDSYLPQGSQGLKAVTKYKLGYDPVEINPEDMLDMANKSPKHMASYSVSDAVATYYLYMNYVHLFVFSLCTIIPMGSEDVLRKGSGTLCEMLLQVEAFRGNIVCPNKTKESGEKFYKGHLLETETYVGGHVECLESGVFRNDIPMHFKLNTATLQQLIDDIDQSLTFALEVENGVDRDEVSNYDEVRCGIIEKLEMLRDTPTREEMPLIYHLDVAAMYPNIILTNRLQPSAIVTPTMCATCDFNDEKNNCKRDMSWVWSGDFMPLTRGDYEQRKATVEQMIVEGIPYKNLPRDRQASILKENLKKFNQTAYHKQKITETETRVATVCQRENPFYVNTVRAFRDRRYEYKKLTKTWSKEIGKAEKSGDMLKVNDAKSKACVYDSLQLAHKCILNSFYGYVMRKGARWMSMEMAGVVTNTGAEVIKDARILVEAIGRPLELDTDGIWCVIPASFPENFEFKRHGGGSIHMSYPCTMLNVGVHNKYTNHQYQNLVNPKSKRYSSQSECSIFFELDGPYRCMVLPASTEEGKLLKKRYAVFNLDGSLAELKGFELKRRGELEIIKTFQEQVFERFLHGASLETCYDAVAQVASFWLQVLETKGQDLEDDELFELISENRTMSRLIEDYGDQKSNSLTVARRLADFLGDGMVKDKGLACKMVIAKRPIGSPVTERAIPTAIFSAEPGIMKHYLRKWTKDAGLNNFDIREILDWDYYLERLGSSIRKIITIPAALQRVPNPVPSLPHPDWLIRIVREKNDKFQQRKITNMFKAPASLPTGDIEDMMMSPSRRAASGNKRPMSTSSRKRALALITEETEVVSKDLIDLIDVEAEANFSIDKENNMGDYNIGGDVDDGMQEGEEEEEEEFDIYADTQSWLKDRKAMWSDLRKKKKDARSNADYSLERFDSARGAALTAGGPKGSLGSFFTNDDSALTNYWQIIEIAETDLPGEFKVFAATSPQSIQCLNLRVPRIFYVNTSQEELDESIGKVVSRVLPRGRKNLNLIQLQLSEARFVHKSKELSDFLNHPNVEGLYELQLPLQMRAVLETGCIVTVSDKRRRVKNDRVNFTLDDLTMKSVSNKFRYLSSGSSDYNRIYVYHSYSKISNLRGCGLWALFFLDEGTAFVWVTNPFGVTERISLTEIYNHYKTLYKTEGVDSDVSFTLHRSKSKDQTRKEVALMISDYQASKPGTSSRTIILSQCNMTARLLRRSLPVLNDFAVVSMPNNESDNNYPALQWQRFAVMRLMQRFLRCGAWWRERLDSARYGQVPIGNLGDDNAVTSIDILYSRLLAKHKHLLWSSKSVLPDLGGHEVYDNKLVAQLPLNPTVVVPGAYRNVCIELNIMNLALNTMKQSSYIQEVEGQHGGILDFAVTLSSKNGDGDDLYVDDSVATAEAFRVMKVMIDGLMKDALIGNNAHAEYLIENFYRWLCGSSSLSYDPALFKSIHFLMAKIFKHLIAELRKLGATIVFADFSRIIVSTPKSDLESAQKYISFLCDTIRGRDLFTFIVLEPARFWDQLLFLDAANYGGIVVREKADEVEEEEEEEEVEDDLNGFIVDDHEVIDKPRKRIDKSTMKIVSHWNISDYLHPDVAEHFQVIVGEYIYRPLMHRRDQLEKLYQAELDGYNGGDFSSKVIDHDGLIDHPFLADLITQHLTQKLLKAIRDIGEMQIASDDFPAPPGSHKKLHNHSLEFIKMVCQVLALDGKVKEEITVLKRTLLKVINLREFASDAQFSNPCLTFVLPNVICTSCNYAKDLDICRDPNINYETNWSCSNCPHEYNMDVLEQQLIQIAESKCVHYQLQDLECLKCKQVKGDNMKEYCECSGSFGTASINAEQLRLELIALNNIARYFRFDLLLESTNFFLYKEVASYKVHNNKSSDKEEQPYYKSKKIMKKESNYIQKSLKVSAFERDQARGSRFDDDHDLSSKGEEEVEEEEEEEEEEKEVDDAGDVMDVDNEDVDMNDDQRSVEDTKGEGEEEAGDEVEMEEISGN